MSFLNWPTEQTLPSPRTQRRRKRLVLELFELFSRVFPEITYELIWESPTINAQAWRLGDTRYVRVYGGLVRHPAMTRSGLALMIAHETGHYLGGLPRDPAMPWLTWQGQADYWAARTAMPRVFGPRAVHVTKRGAREILALHDDLSAQLDDDEPDLSPQCRYSIFCAGAAGAEIPACAMAEFEQEFGSKC
jgi:Peptidase family M48